MQLCAKALKKRANANVVIVYLDIKLQSAFHSETPFHAHDIKGILRSRAKNYRFPFDTG